jgi:hypothetical protein
MLETGEQHKSSLSPFFFPPSEKPVYQNNAMIMIMFFGFFFFLQFWEQNPGPVACYTSALLLELYPILIPLIHHGIWFANILLFPPNFIRAMVYVSMQCLLELVNLIT